MDKCSRTKRVKLNSTVTIITQIFQILLGFLIRKAFIDYLGVAYLGYNSVFANILQMLNLADMGIGVAITSFLYKPLAENDQRKITAIMKIYKKLYSIIGFIVLFVGLLVSIFLNYLVPDATCGIWFLRLLFYINLIGTVSTYFLAYKRTLLVADQKSYLSNVIDGVIFFIISILQIISIITLKNYIIYLSLNIAKNIISNIIISIKVNKEFSYINENADCELMNEYKPQIKNYVKDVFFSRIGAAVYYSTDNIILSMLKGSLMTGFLSNYTLITGQLNGVVSQVLSSVQATFGNFIITTKDKISRLKMTDNYLCVNFCIGNFCFICFSLLAQPFVKMFFGENILINFSSVIWLGINLLLTFLIQLPSQVFVIHKLFKYDRPIIIISAFMNIVISIVLTKIMGIDGVLIGTFVTSLIYLFSRFYIIAKHVYEISFFYYVKKLLFYGIVSVFSFALVYIVTKNISRNGIIWFIVKAIVVAILSILSTSFCLSFTKEFRVLVDKLIPLKLRILFNKFVIGGMVVTISISSLFIGKTYKIGFSQNGNKSYRRTDSYEIEKETGRNIFSLSFDDTIDIFADIEKNKYNSIFENQTLKWFNQLHDQYGVVISCYIFYETDGFNLSMFSDKYKEEFIENSDWLRFGFHSRNSGTDYDEKYIVNDYMVVINELIRIMGSETIDNVIRLSRYQGSENNIRELTKVSSEPIKGLFTSDDKGESYYLNDTNNSYIYSHDELYDYTNNLYFLSTDFRIEYVDSVYFKIKELSKSSWNNQTGDLVVFSHEYLISIENMSKIEKICNYAMQKDYRFAFFEDVLV